MAALSSSASSSKDSGARFAASPQGHLIAGAWIRGGGALPVENPSTALVMAEIADAGQAEIEAAAQAARAALHAPVWAQMRPFARERLLHAVADALEADLPNLAALEMDDAGLIAGVATHAPSVAARLFRYYAGWCGKISGVAPRMDARAPTQSILYTRREPVGVVAAIIPWNFPLVMAAAKLAPALAAGCTIVLKPAEQASLAVLRLGVLLQQAGVPPGVVNIVTGRGAGAGALLAAHPGVDKIAFTGSTETGRAIVRAAATDFKRVSLELGGKSPFIIFPDADLDAAIAGAAQAAFNMSGQNCACGARLLVHNSVYEAVMEGLAARARALRIGAARDPRTQIGPLISAPQRDRVLDFIQSARDAGATPVAGGERAPGEGYFVRPTILTKVGPEMRVWREEIFGPVVCAVPFETLENAVAMANDSAYGLVASVWTRDLATAGEMAARLRAGTVSANHHGLADITAPFGGFGASGWGREYGAEGLDAYLETKTVSLTWSGA